MEHPAPTRRGWLLANPQEAQAGFDQQGEAESERQLDDDGRGDVRHDMASEQPLGGGTKAPSRFDVGLLPDGDDLAPEQSHEARHEHDGNGDGGVVDVSTQQRGHGQGHDERREREEGVHRPHDHRVDCTSEEPGHQAERDGDDGSQTDDLERGPQRDASSPDQAAENVAAQVVRPEPVRGRRSGVDGVDVSGVGRVRCDQGRADGSDDHHEEEDQAGDGPSLMEESDPEPGSPLRQLVGAVSRIGDVCEADERIAGAGGTPGAHVDGAHDRRTFGFK